MGARRAAEFAVKKKDNQFSARGMGGSSTAPHQGLTAPGPWPGFPYFQLSEVSPMQGLEEENW